MARDRPSPWEGSIELVNVKLSVIVVLGVVVVVKVEVEVMALGEVFAEFGVGLIKTFWPHAVMPNPNR